MTGRTHDLAAVTALSIVVLNMPLRDISLATAIVAVFANLIGGIAPDIDQPTAPFWRNLPIGKYFGRVFDNFTGGHRFLTHSIVGLVIAGFLVRSLLVFLGPILGSVDTGYVWWAFMIGMASHIVMDMFTKEGVPLFLPFPFKIGIPPIRKLRITTGKWVESTLVFPGLILVNLAIYHLYQEQILELIRIHLK